MLGMIFFVLLLNMTNWIWKVSRAASGDDSFVMAACAFLWFFSIAGSLFFLFNVSSDNRKMQKENEERWKRIMEKNNEEKK
jgi:hypothetical protein